MRAIAVLLILLLLIQPVLAHSKVDDDKKLNFSGTRMFYVGMAATCSYYWDGTTYGTCNESFAKLKNFSHAFWFVQSLSDANWKDYANATILNATENAVYFSASTITADDAGAEQTYFTNNILWREYFYGYDIKASLEEPDTEADIVNITSHYNIIKSYDSDHLVFLNTYEYALGALNVSQGADVIAFDGYNYRANCGINNDTARCQINGDPTLATLYYYLDDFIFAWERNINQKFGLKIGDEPDPVVIAHTAFGAHWHEATNAHWSPMAQDKIRAATYFSVIQNVSGVMFWGNKPYHSYPTSLYGLATNDTESIYYNNIAGELTSSEMQEVLLLPILNNSWNAADTWDNKIKFSHNPTRKIYIPYESVNRNQLAYAWKHNSTTNKSYLIVVNKANTSLSNVVVTVAGVTNTDATTIGVDGTGSSAPNAIHSIDGNGNFTDTFDAYAAHVYEISNATAGEGEDTSTPWITGIGGQFFQNKSIGSNRTCINQGNGAIGICKLADNFNDNNTVGWNQTGDLAGTFSSSNGTLNQSGAYTSYQYWNVTSYENMSIFTKFKEYNNLSSYIDASDLRGNLSRPNANPSWLNCQFSIGSPTQIRAYIYCYNGSSWLTVNNTATKTRYLNDWNYAGFFANGTYFRGYLSNVSYTDAMTTVLASGTSSQWLNGTTIQFGGQPNSAATISWDEIRAVELDALGNQYLSGNYTMNYTVPASQYAKNITINGSYCSGCNYTLYYRQNGTGSYTVVEGVKTSNSTIELPTPYYQSIDIQLEMNASISDTLWITNISVGVSTTAGNDTTPPSSITGLTNTTGNFYHNWTWTNPSDSDFNGTTIYINGTFITNVTNITASYNLTADAHNESTISTHTFDVTGNSNTTWVNHTSIIPNNIPSLSSGNHSIDEGQTVYIQLNSTDLDSDTLTYSVNRTDLFTDFSTSTGKGNWTTNYSSSGTIYLDLGVTDGYGGQTNYTIQVTVNDTQVNFFPPTPVLDAVFTGNFYKNITWSAGSTNLSAEKDSFTRLSTPDDNHGDWSVLMVSPSSHNTYIKFNVSTISPSDISSAKINIYCYDFCSGTIDAYRVTADWDENTITWNGAPANGTTILASSSVNTGWVIVDLTDEIRSYLNGSVTDYGVVISNGSVDTNLYYSRHSPYYPPYLEVVFSNNTDSFNVSRNSIWTNGTTALFINSTATAHSWINDTIYAYNTSGTGSLSTSALTNNTRIPNNAPTQSAIGSKSVDESQTLSFQIISTDTDGDSLTHTTNATHGYLNSTGYFTWTTNYTDSGTYYWYFNTTDNYSAVDTEIVTITVTNVPLTITSYLPSSNPSTNSGTIQPFNITLNRTANTTWHYNTSLSQTNTTLTVSNYTNTSLTEIAGTHNITVDATDDIDSTTRTWLWTVIAPAPQTTTGGGGGGGGTPIQTPTTPTLQPTNPPSVNIFGSGLNWDIKIMNEGASEQEYIINWVLRTQSGAIIDSGVLSKKILPNEIYTVPLTFMGLFPGNYAIKVNVQYGIHQSEANQFFSVGIDYSMTEIIILLSILTVVFLASLYFRKPKK